MLPTEAPLWAHLEQSIQGLVRAYGYQQIRTPIVEQTALFKRGIGEVTDIVEKEMYSFEDSLNGEQLTLRPEGTAAAVDRKSTRLNSSHSQQSRMPSSA